MLRDLFAEWERERLIAALDAAGVPCGAINTVADVFKDPQVKARGMLKHVPHPSGVDVPQVSTPMRFADAPLQTQAAPPLLGQHSDDILRPSSATAPHDICRACAAARSASDGRTMKLHWSPKSPYVRKVMICAHELDLVDRLELVRSVAAMLKPNARLMQDNPLSKIPTLVLDDGFTLFDSVVICEYLNDLGGGALFPTQGSRQMAGAALARPRRRPARRADPLAQRARARGAAAGR